jgi:riboflavin kinase/FMN adenylyltransferase
MVDHYTSLDNVVLNNTWLTIGSFDGIHIGHQKLINELNENCHQSGAKSVVLTFHPHPAVILRGRSGAFYLTTPSEKLDLLDRLGVDIVVTHPFTYELSQSTAKDYLTYLKQHLDFRQLWIGHDFALGKGREGNFDYLQSHQDEFGYTVHAVEPVMREGKIVSSSLIRSLIQEGRVNEVSYLLGRPYKVEGIVVHGDGRGKLIGIPTANLETGDDKLIPAAGVYACKVSLDNRNYPAAVNIGTRPTFESTDHKSHVEAHILDFSGDLYSKVLKLEFFEYLRGEERYQSVDELIRQINIDINQTRETITNKKKIHVNP